MTRTLKIAASFALAALVAPVVVSGDDRDVIDYREHIMSTLEEQSAALGMIVSTVIPGDNTAAHLQAIALTAQTALKAFEPKVPGGEAKPEVWTNWEDFSKRMNEFVKATGEVAALAKGKRSDDSTLTAKITDALSCKSCHEVYRKEKK